MVVAAEKFVACRPCRPPTPPAINPNLVMLDLSHDCPHGKFLASNFLDQPKKASNDLTLLVCTERRRVLKSSS